MIKNSIISLTKSEITDFVLGVSYPASRNEIVRYAKENNFPREVVQLLIHIPNREYVDPLDINHALNHVGQNDK